MIDAAHFRCCCLAHGACGQTEIQQVQKLQSRAARIIYSGNYNAPSKPLIETIGQKTIEVFLRSDTQVIVFKSVNGLAPQYLSDFICRKLD